MARQTKTPTVPVFWYSLTFTLKMKSVYSYKGAADDDSHEPRAIVNHNFKLIFVRIITHLQYKHVFQKRNYIRRLFSVSFGFLKFPMVCLWRRKGGRSNLDRNKKIAWMIKFPKKVWNAPRFWKCNAYSALRIFPRNSSMQGDFSPKFQINWVVLRQADLRRVSE